MADMTPTTAFAHAPASAAKTTFRSAVDTLMTAIDTLRTTASTGSTRVQTIAVSGTPTGGTYPITITGSNDIATQTITVAYNATAAAIQTAIRALSGEGLSQTTVTETGVSPNLTHTITLRGNHESIAITAANTGLTGGVPVVTVATTVAYAAIPEFSAQSTLTAKQSLVAWCEELASNMRQ